MSEKFEFLSPEWMTAAKRIRDEYPHPEVPAAGMMRMNLVVTDTPFAADVQGHIDDDAVAEALMGLHRFSPKIVFLGSYPRADRQKSEHEGNNSNSEFHNAEKWLKALRSGK